MKYGREEIISHAVLKDSEALIWADWEVAQVALVLPYLDMRLPSDYLNTRPKRSKEVSAIWRLKKMENNSSFLRSLIHGGQKVRNKWPLLYS